MRIFVAALFMLAIGLGAGFGMTAVEFSSVQNRFRGAEADSLDEKNVDELPQFERATFVNGTEFDFGILTRNETRDHVFLVRNDGARSMELAVHNVSCGRCVSSTFGFAIVSPQETVEVPVRFSTRKFGDRFSEYLELETSDPELPIVRLTIVGNVTNAIHLSVPELEVDSISSSQATKALFDVLAFKSKTIELLKYEMTNSLTSSNFQVEAKPLDVSDLDRTPKPTAGMTVEVTIKPGLPIGPITQGIRLFVKTDQETDEEIDEETDVELPITGAVVSDVSVVGGRNFRRTSNVLTLGSVDAKVGVKGTLRLLVKGALRDKVELSVESIQPDDIVKATIGERQTISNGAVHMYSLEVEVPAGSSLVNHLGVGQSERVKIVIGTTHPDAKQLHLFVSFATE